MIEDQVTASNRAGGPATDVQEERRQTGRVPLHLKGPRCLVDPGYLEFAIFDLSVGGIGLLSDRYLEPGRRIRAKLCATPESAPGAAAENHGCAECRSRFSGESHSVPSASSTTVYRFDDRVRPLAR